MRSRPPLAFLALFSLSACGGAKATLQSEAPATGDAPATARAPLDTAPAQRPEIVFTRKPLVPGVARIARSWVGRSMLMTVNSGDRPVTVEDVSDEVEEKREDVLEASGAIVTKLKVTVLVKSEVGIRNGRPHSKSSVVAGKTYVVAAAKNGALEVATERGGKVTKREGDVLARMYRGFGREDPFFDAIPERPLHAGDRIDALATGLKSALAGAMAAEGDGRVVFGDVSVVLRGTRDAGGSSCGVFSVRLQVTQERGGLAARSDMSGEMLVRSADGWPISLELEGPVLLEGAVGDVSFAADGRRQAKLRWSEP